MNKAQFLSALRSKLFQLPREELEHTISFYEEMIDDRVEDGMSEEEAVASLENVNDIADRILKETSFGVLVKTKVKPRGGWSALTIILAILAAPIWLPLTFVFISIALSIYAILWSVIIVIAGVILTVVAVGLALLVSCVFMLTSFPAGSLLFAGFSLICIGMTIMLIIGIRYAIIGICHLSAVLGTKIKSLFIKKER